MSPVQNKTPWQRHIEKRTRKNTRLVRMAMGQLKDKELPDLPAHRQLGIHLGLIALTNSSTKIIDIRSRARWLLHWMIGYLIEQGFTVEEAATENALDACEALMAVAVQAKEKQSKLSYKNGRLLHADGTAVVAAWVDVYNSAWQFVSALENIA